MSEQKTGALSASAAYVIWGSFPLYFKAMTPIPPLEMLSHRMAWSLVFLTGVLAYQGHWRWLKDALKSPKLMGIFTFSALTLAANWFVYIWAVQHNHVIEGSLGYFINPLVNVVIGAVVLKERLRWGQWASVSIAAIGVFWLTWVSGHIPWIALALALTFSAYGLQRKLAPLDALEGLALETLALSPLAVAALAWWVHTDQAVFVHASPALILGAMAAGPITAIPLLLFAYGARRIPFSLLGLLQYIGPTLQLICGVWLLNEPFEPQKIVGFGLIWIALAIYSLEGWLRLKK